MQWSRTRGTDHEARPMEIRAVILQGASWSGGANRVTGTELTRNFLQDFLIDIEVGVDVLDIIVIFESLDQADHLSGLLAFELDIVLRDHGDFCRGRLDARRLHRLDYRLEC